MIGCHQQHAFAREKKRSRGGFCRAMSTVIASRLPGSTGNQARSAPARS
jgi:hypothetical protein